VRSFLQVASREEKLDALAFNENGYLGVHLDTRLGDESARELNELFL
jgi:hypothetical protein